MIEIGSTFCILPWIHISSRADGRMRQCCRSRNFIEINANEANINREAVKDIWNSEYMKNLRKDLSSGKRPASCGLCWEEEEQKSGSRRTSENELWSRRIDFQAVTALTKEDGHLDVMPIYWDLRLGNACNLKCVMCNPTNSSLWLKDTGFLDRYPHLKTPSQAADLAWGEKEEIWNTLRENLHSVQELYFSGGEPLMSKQHKQILQLAIDEGVSERIHLRYDTNGILIHDSILNLWKSFKSVHLNLSIDGIGPGVEYIRYPLKWNRLELTFDKLETCGLTNMAVNPQFSLSALNAIDFLTFIDWKLNKKFKKIGNLSVTGDEVGESHLVTDPKFLSLRVLPKEKKSLVKDYYSQFIQDLPNKEHLFTRTKSWQRLARKLELYLQYMEEEDWTQELFPMTKRYLNELDQTRGTDFRKTFSWLEDI